MSVEQGNNNILSGYGIVDAALDRNESVMYEIYGHLAEIGLGVAGGMRSEELMVVGAIMGARYADRNPDLSQVQGQQF